MKVVDILHHLVRENLLNRAVVDHDGSGCSNMHNTPALISTFMSSHTIVIEPDSVRMPLISYNLEQSCTISLNLMSSESYCLGYVSWSHDMIVLDLMSMPLLTCDLGESHAISYNLVMDEMCFTSSECQLYGSELDSIVTSLYLAVSQPDLEVSHSCTHCMIDTDFHMSAHSSSVVDTLLDVESDFISFIVLYIICLTAYEISYVVHITCHTLCDGATVRS